MSWCGDKDMMAFDSGPSVCFCQTVITSIANIIFLAVLIYRYLKIFSMIACDFLDYRTKMIMRGLVIGGCAEGVLILVYSLMGDLSSSTYFYVTFQLLAWWICSFVVYNEIWRLKRYPGTSVCAFMGVNLVCNVLTIAMGSSGSSTSTTALGAVVVLLNTALLLLGLFKDSFRSEEDLIQDELKLSSVDFQSSNPVKYERHSLNSPSQHSRTWVFTKLEGDEEEDAHDAAELEEQRALRGGWSVWDWCFSQRSRRHSRAKEMADHDMSEPLVISSSRGGSTSGQDPSLLQHQPSTSKFNYNQHNSPNKKFGSLSPKGGRNGSPNPIVQSALERNLGGGAASDSRNSSRANSSSVGGFFSKMFGASKDGGVSKDGAMDFDYNSDTERGRYVSNNSIRDSGGSGMLSANSLSQNDLSSAGGNNQNNNTNRDSFMTQSSMESIRLSSSDTSQSYDYSFGSNGSAPAMSRALLHVMDSHKAKIAATNPILEPRGGGEIGNSSGAVGAGGVGVGVRNAKKSKTSTAINSNKLLSPDHGSSGGFDRAGPLSFRAPVVGDCMITVQRWGTRRKVFDATEVNIAEANAVLDEASKALKQPATVTEGEEGEEDKGGSEDNDGGSSSPKRVESTSSSNLTEVEYEIAIRIGSSNQSFSDQQDWSNANKGNRGPAPLYWTVWRTTSEILALHGNAHSAMGDMAPRRPRLKSTIKQAADLTNAELLADMRSVAVFLNALLRNQQSAKLPSLFQFLEFETHVKAATAAAQAGLSNPSTLEESGSQGASPWNMLSPDSPKGYGGDNMGGSGGFTSQFPSINNAGGNSAISSGNPAGGVSLMAAAEENAASQVSSQQDKWRKLFFHMRVKLKPHDIGIRCRLFEGVISGGEVAAWLIRSTTASLTDPAPGQAPSSQQQYQHARDTHEAISIGQELLSCGLLMAVCSGFEEDDSLHRDLEEDEGYAPEEGSAAASAVGTVGAAGGTVEAAALKNSHVVFSVMPGYIYRFPMKSSSTGTNGASAVFGANVSITIPDLTVADDEENSKPTRDTMGFFIFNNGLITSTKPDSEVGGGGAGGAEGGTLTPEKGGGGASGGALAAVSGGTGGHVKYLVAIEHGGDKWQTWKRYREFEALNRNLIKEGVRPDVQLPSKALTGKFRSSKDAQLQQRKLGLEQYLKAIVISTVNSESPKAVTILAMFLDEDFNNLRINTTGQSASVNN